MIKWPPLKSWALLVCPNRFFLTGSGLGLVVGWTLASLLRGRSDQTATSGAVRQTSPTTSAPTHSSGRGKSESTGATLSTLSSQSLASDWRQLLQQAISDPDADTARDRLMRLIELTANDQLGELAQALKSISPVYLRESGLSMLMGRWSIHHPQQAAVFCLELPNHDSKAALCETLAANWGEVDREGALAWARQLTRGMVRERAMNKLTQVLAASDPAAAMKLIDREITPDNQHEAINRVMQLWATHDFEGAQHWIKQAGESDLSFEYRRHTVLGLSRTDPIKAATYVSQMEASDQQTNLAVEVAQEWSNRDPGAAAQWAVQFPEGTARDQSLQIIAAQYAQLEPEKAIQWMSGMKSDHDRNQAATSAIRMLVDRDLPLAHKLLPYVNEAETIDELTRVIRDSWQRVDPQNSPYK